MRRPQRSIARRRQVAEPFTIPAPVEGWDASSPLAAMKPSRAVILDNFFPEPAEVTLRRGYTSHGTGVGAGAVESLMAWEGPSSSKLFAAGGTAIYDVTAAGAGSSSVTSLTNARFQHVMMRTSGGNFLFIVNGADDPRHYNGTVWATPSITTITGANAINVSVHKKRLWFVLKDSTKGAYMPVDVVAGAGAEFDFGAEFDKGGYLMATATWTRDGGDGLDDFFVAISSRGQVVLYQGTDPSSANTWAKVGVFNIGAPIGRRCFYKVGADLAIITVDGVLPLSLVLGSDRAAADRVAITARISDAMNKAARLYASNYGWQLIAHPKGTRAILNVPTTEGATSEQYVMNTLTGAWCRFTGQNAICWQMLGDDLYFGGTGGKVFKADTGTDDNGEPIAYDVQTAWNYLKKPGQLKNVGQIAAVVGTDGSISPSMGVLTDFRDRLPSATATFSASTGAEWDDEDWDTPDWASIDEVQRVWTGAEATGNCLSVRMRGTAEGLRLTLHAFDLTHASGGMV